MKNSKLSFIKKNLLILCALLFSTSVLYAGVLNKSKAVEAIKKSEFEKAAPLLKKYLVNHSNDVEAVLLLAKCYYKSKKFEEALALLDKANGRFENNKDVVYELGMAYFTMEKYEKGIEVFGIALEIDPSFSQARFMLGLCYHELMSIDEAYKQYRILLKENKKLAEKLINIITT